MRSRLYFERVKAEDGSEDDPDLRALKTMKSNYARTGEEIRMRWRSGVFVIEGKAGGSFAQVASQAQAGHIFLDLLISYEAEGHHVSASPSANYAPAIFSKDARSKPVGKAGLTRAMNRLFEAGRIVVVECGPESKRRTQIVLAGKKEEKNDLPTPFQRVPTEFQRPRPLAP